MLSLRRAARSRIEVDIEALHTLNLKMLQGFENFLCPIKINYRHFEELNETSQKSSSYFENVSYFTFKSLFYDSEGEVLNFSVVQKRKKKGTFSFIPWESKIFFVNVDFTTQLNANKPRNE